MQVYDTMFFPRIFTHIHSFCTVFAMYIRVLTLDHAMQVLRLAVPIQWVCAKHFLTVGKLEIMESYRNFNQAQKWRNHCVLNTVAASATSVHRLKNFASMLWYRRFCSVTGPSRQGFEPRLSFLEGQPCDAGLNAICQKDNKIMPRVDPKKI